MSTAIAILAAGRGSRLGGDASKPLLEWRGRPLVAWAVDAALDSGLRPVLVVVGYRGDEVRAPNRMSGTAHKKAPADFRFCLGRGLCLGAGVTCMQPFRR